MDFPGEIHLEGYDRGSWPGEFSRHLSKTILKNQKQSANFAKLTGKLIWPIQIRDSDTQVLSYEFCEVCNNTFFIEHLRFLLFDINSRLEIPWLCSDLEFTFKFYLKGVVSSSWCFLRITPFQTKNFKIYWNQRIKWHFLSTDVIYTFFPDRKVLNTFLNSWYIDFT